MLVFTMRKTWKHDKLKLIKIDNLVIFWAIWVNIEGKSIKIKFKKGKKSTGSYAKFVQHTRRNIFALVWNSKTPEAM